MPRKHRIIPPGIPQHIVQRGHNKQQVFRSSLDYRKYLSLVETYSNRYNCPVMAYCLMPNHIHLLVRPQDRDSLIKCMHSISFKYAKFFNFTADRRGALWESRYHSSTVDDEQYLWQTALYICLNPVRAGLVDDPCQYSWSSSDFLLEGRRNHIEIEDWIPGTHREAFKDIVLTAAMVPPMVPGTVPGTR